MIESKTNPSKILDKKICLIKLPFIAIDHVLTPNNDKTLIETGAQMDEESTQLGSSVDIEDNNYIRKSFKNEFGMVSKKALFSSKRSLPISVRGSSSIEHNNERTESSSSYNFINDVEHVSFRESVNNSKCHKESKKNCIFDNELIGKYLAQGTNTENDYDVKLNWNNSEKAPQPLEQIKIHINISLSNPLTVLPGIKVKRRKGNLNICNNTELNQRQHLVSKICLPNKLTNLRTRCVLNFELNKQFYYFTNNSNIDKLSSINEESMNIGKISKVKNLRHKPPISIRRFSIANYKHSHSLIANENLDSKISNVDHNYIIQLPKPGEFSNNNEKIAQCKSLKSKKKISCIFKRRINSQSFKNKIQENKFDDINKRIDKIIENSKVSIKDIGIELGKNNRTRYYTRKHVSYRNTKFDLQRTTEKRYLDY